MIHWQITEKKLALLDSIQDIEAGTLDIDSNNLDDDSFKRIMRFVTEHGALLHSLALHPRWSGEKVDLGDFDFATRCPHLQSLDIERIVFNESVFAHPTLESINLLNADYKGPRAITIGDGLSERDCRQFKGISMMDCQITA